MKQAARIWIPAASAVAAIVVPAWLLWPAEEMPVRQASQGTPVRPSPAPGLAAAMDRSLFGSAMADDAADGSGAGQASTTDAPELVGIVGRLPGDAVALVRAENGRARSLAIGDSFLGWRLESLAADAAFFTRGTERARVALPPAQ